MQMPVDLGVAIRQLRAPVGTEARGGSARARASAAARPTPRRRMRSTSAIEPTDGRGGIGRNDRGSPVKRKPGPQKTPKPANPRVHRLWLDEHMLAPSGLVKSRVRAKKRARCVLPSAADTVTGTLARAVAKKVRTPPPPRRVQAPQRRDPRKRLDAPRSARPGCMRAAAPSSRPLIAAAGRRHRRQTATGAAAAARRRDHGDELQRPAGDPEDEGALGARVPLPRRPPGPARPDDARRAQRARRATSTPTSTSS